MTVDQPDYPSLPHRHREQAPSHICPASPDRYGLTARWIVCIQIH